MIAEAFLRYCGAFAEDMILRPKAAAVNQAVMLLEVCGALCDGSMIAVCPLLCLHKI